MISGCVLAVILLVLTMFSEKKIRRNASALAVK
jgi:hypothetical protein